MRGRDALRRLAFELAVSDGVERTAMAVPPLRAAAERRMARYLGGPDAAAALAIASRLAEAGIAASVDLFGENVEDAAVAELATEHYLELATKVAEVPGTDISLDCSHLGLDREPKRCAERVTRIAAELPAGARLQLGAEESSRADAVLTIAETAAASGLPVMATLQANLRRSDRDLDRLLAAGIPIRLVKGAYAEPADIGLPWGPETDAAYLRLAARLAGAGAPHALATHDPAILTASGEAPIEMLLGVRPREAVRLAEAGRAVRVYVPFGPRWFRYGARRLAESIGA